MSQQVNVYRKLKMFPGAIVEGSFGPMFDMGGTTYYVNNITGSSTADGLSWNSAVAEVSDAITLSETYRELQASTNERIRNTIVVQSTDTAYEGLDDLGEEYNLIGLGPPTGGRGYLAGPEIGNASRNGLDPSAGSYNGVYIANIQFSGQVGTSPAFEVATLDQSCIEDCGFYEDEAATSQMTDGILITTGANGLVLRRNHIGVNANLVSTPIDGLHVSGSIFRNSLVEYCLFSGHQKAFHIAAEVLYADSTMVWHNHMGTLGHGSCDYGIYDACPSGKSTGGLITYAWNTIEADNPIAEVTSSGSDHRFIMNYAESAVISSFTDLS